MQPQNPDYAAQVQRIIDQAVFVGHVGIRYADCGPGWCETTLRPAPELMQQDGFLHAGVLATMADHTAGAAAGTLVAADQGVLSVEFKINLLRPAAGDRVRCRAEVLRPGRTLTVAEAWLWSQQGEAERLVAKAVVTLAIVPWPRPGTPATDG